MAQAYQLYPCSSAEQLFQRVLRSSNATGIFVQGLQLDLDKSQFQPQPRLLFQNNALGEWFKVRLTQHQGVSLGLTVSHSKEVLEHYISYFFPQLQLNASTTVLRSPQENWIHLDIVSLLLFQLLKRSSHTKLQQYLPKALQRTLELLKTQKQGHEAQDQHLWAFVRNVAQLFLTYDYYREELQEALAVAATLEAPRQTPETGTQPHQPQGESWQQNLWHSVQKLTQQGFYWHGKLIEQIQRQKLRPQDIEGNLLEPEPLYIIGSGFLSPSQLSFYCYLSQFTQLHHFWLTPTQFPLTLCRDAATMLWGPDQKRSTETPKLCRRKSYDKIAYQIGERLGGLPQFLWLENSLHSAALLSWQPSVTWHEPELQAAQPATQLSLLQLVQQQLRNCATEQTTLSEPSQLGQRKLGEKQQLERALGDGSIQYFACNDMRREVEVLKDQVLASLDAHPDWQLNDIAVLSPDINKYQTLIQSIFQNIGGDYHLNCNFIDLRRGLASSSSGYAATLSQYFAAFGMLLGFVQSQFRFDECLRLLENPCARSAEILQAKPNSFWRKVFQHWKLSWGIHQQHRQNTSSNSPSDTFGNSELSNQTDTKQSGSRGTWQGALELFVSDYLNDYRQGPLHINHLGPNSANFGLAALCQQMSLDQAEAQLLAEVLQFMLKLYEYLKPFRSQVFSISEWVVQLENLQDKFLFCRSEGNYSDSSDRSVINTSLRNFLAIEKSLLSGLQPNPAMELDKNLRFPFVVIQNLLQQKLEQNFSFKGRYLTQGVTCASLQPYRSVPFRMICVLGLNEKDFPRSSTPLRFDLCAELPQHLSHAAQEQHIFAELLISAKDRLLLFYRNCDTGQDSKGTGHEKNPSVSLHELAYFIAKILQCDEEPVWQRLLQVHPLFPFDNRYFEKVKTGSAPEVPTSFFSYSRTAYEQNQALEASYCQAPVQTPVTCSSHNPVFTCDLNDVLAVISDAPSYFWQHYSGLNPATTPDSWQRRSELPLLEQFASNVSRSSTSYADQLLMKNLAPIKIAKWQQSLWNEREYLLVLLRLSQAELRQVLQNEGWLGAELFQDGQWGEFVQGLEAIRLGLEQVSANEQLSSDFWRKRQYHLSLQCQSVQLQAELSQAQQPMAEARSTELPLRLLLSPPKELDGASLATWLFPALRIEIPELVNISENLEIPAIALLEAELPRFWACGERILCWNHSPFGMPHVLYNLLQTKLFCAIRQYCAGRYRNSPIHTLMQANELLQLEWLYGKGLNSQRSDLPVADSCETGLAAYVWLLWRASWEALPLSCDFLVEILSKKPAQTFRSALAEFCQQHRQQGPNTDVDVELHRLQELLQEQWRLYQEELKQARTAQQNRFGTVLQYSEAMHHLPVSFASETLQHPRFWLLLHELLESLTPR